MQFSKNATTIVNIISANIDCYLNVYFLSAVQFSLYGNLQYSPMNFSAWGTSNTELLHSGRIPNSTFYKLK